MCLRVRVVRASGTGNFPCDCFLETSRQDLNNGRIKRYTNTEGENISLGTIPTQRTKRFIGKKWHLGEELIFPRDEHANWLYRVVSFDIICTQTAKRNSSNCSYVFVSVLCILHVTIIIKENKPWDL